MDGIRTCDLRSRVYDFHSRESRIPIPNTAHMYIVPQLHMYWIVNGIRNKNHLEFIGIYGCEMQYDHPTQSTKLVDLTAEALNK